MWEFPNSMNPNPVSVLRPPTRRCPHQRREHDNLLPRLVPERRVVRRVRVGADGADRQHEQPVSRAFEPEPEIFRAGSENGGVAPDDRHGDHGSVRRIDDQLGGRFQPRLPGRCDLRRVCEEGGKRNFSHLDRRGHGENPDGEHDADQRKRRQLEVEQGDRRDHNVPDRAGHFRRGATPEPELRHELAVLRFGPLLLRDPPTGTNTTPDIDDADGQRRLFAIKDPCFIGGTINPTTCVSSSSASSVAFSTLVDVTNISSVPSEATANLSGFKGWYIRLDPSANYIYDNAATRAFRAERVITDPLATTSGVVFFTTYKPYGDECALGGKSFLWALRYNTGGTPPSAVMKGKALVQVSTASVEQLDLASAFQMAAGEGAGGLHKDGRRTGAIEGVPPTAQGLSLLSQPPPVKRIMHMMER